MIRVLIVDDQEMIRVGLEAVLRSFADLTVVGSAADGFEALPLIDAETPDVVLMDIRMPGIDGVEATRRIRERHAATDVRILVLTTFEDDENVFAALRAGADGFLNKGVGPGELADGIRQVASGGGALSAGAASTLIRHATHHAPATVDATIAARFDALTAREREIAVAIMSGRSNQEIASELFVSPFTVKTHANRAMAKVGARDRAQLIALAHQAGLG
ncbi:MAG TPA: response regulator transcription factor [Rhodoglobus sp.]|nr:response regulator transcription factor [Rhodoglobus sp.]